MCAVAVLMYHALEQEGDPAGARDPGEQLYVLEVSRFREQMSHLKRHGYRTFLWDELQALERWPDKAVVLSFDDGHRSNFTLALPILLEHGFKAHFFVTTGWTGTEPFLDQEQIRGLHQAGMALGSHGVTHRFLPDLPQADLEWELRASRTELEACLGVPVRSISYPGGRVDRRTQEAARAAGYRLAFGSVPGYCRPGRRQTLIDRIAVTVSTTPEAFASLLEGRGLNRIMLRHALLSATKSVLGNQLYGRLRAALIRPGGQSGRAEP